MNLLFLAPYPFGRVASQRFRFEQYWEVLAKDDQLTFSSFLSEESFEVLYSKGYFFRKLSGVVSGFYKRFLLLFSLYRYEIVFIHREAAPVGPPVLEWLITKVFRKKLIYDFDDAIWLKNTSGENKLAAALKCHWKVKYICTWAWKVTCGNEFLADYARKFNEKVIYLPTTLDTDLIPDSGTGQKTEKVMTIGWTGTHSTLKYLNLVLPLLQKLEESISFNFVVIADRKPDLPLKNFTFIRWRKETEWEDLARLDIGLMPLEQTAWEEGKCGFKALQYMASGIPAIVSATQANRRIIHSGADGFICHTPQEWLQAIHSLIADRELYTRFAENGKIKVASEFSKKRWSVTFTGLFRNS